MSQEEKLALLKAISEIFQDNVGQRMTVALANGLLQVIDQELQARFVEPKTPS